MQRYDYTEYSDDLLSQAMALITEARLTIRKQQREILAHTTRQKLVVVDAGTCAKEEKEYIQKISISG